MTLYLPHQNITAIPDTEPEAVPELWNSRYREIDENFQRLANYTGFGQCETGADEAEKVATVKDFSLLLGSSVSIAFTESNSAQNPKLNVSGTGSYPLWADGKAIEADDIEHGRIYEFRFDGEHWVLADGASIESHLLDPDPTDVFNRIYGISHGDIIGGITISQLPIVPEPEETFENALTNKE